MKTKLIVSVLCCQLILIQEGNGQHTITHVADSISENADSIVSDVTPLKNTTDFDRLEYENALLIMEDENIKEAYNKLLKKVEKLQMESDRYQKAIQQNSLIVSPKISRCPDAHSSLSNCGEAFLESSAPATVNEDVVMTFFVPENYRSAELCIFDFNGKLLLENKIAASGYGQITILAGKLMRGIYNSCLLVDNRKMDCRRLIVLK
jgi:hypothetical protein